MSYQLIMVAHALALEVNTEGKLMATSRAKGDPFKIAKRNSWTNETGIGTLAARKRALADVLFVCAANIPNYEVPSTVAKALGPDLVAENLRLAAEARAEAGL